MTTLSLVIPCYNEEATLDGIVSEILKLASADLALELVIVDDCSKDRSREIARQIAERVNAQPGKARVKLCFHEVNQGKGAALRTGFMQATGDYAGIQDADFEYNPQDYLKMLKPLMENRADIVLGSRYLRKDDRIGLKWWHSSMNRFLTFLSDIFTDLDISDMETCYKLFRREVIQKIAPHLKENRFGFEPEVISLVAQGTRLEGWHVGEVSIDYHPQTSPPKSDLKNFVHSLYCIFHYNAPSLPMPMQLVIYFFIGLSAAIANVAAYMVLLALGLKNLPSIAIAFLFSSAVNYLLCIAFLFRHKVRWSAGGEILSYAFTLCVMGGLDYGITTGLRTLSIGAFWAKSLSDVIGFIGNYLFRKFFVFGGGSTVANAQDAH